MTNVLRSIIKLKFAKRYCHRNFKFSGRFTSSGNGQYTAKLTLRWMASPDNGIMVSVNRKGPLAFDKLDVFLPIGD